MEHLGYDDDEDRITVKLGVSDVPRTKVNGRSSTIAVLANFKCGLPDAIKRNKAEFALYRGGKDKRVMLVEDAQNQVCYYGKRQSSEVDQTLSFHDALSIITHPEPCTISTFDRTAK